LGALGTRQVVNPAELMKEQIADILIKSLTKIEFDKLMKL